MRHESLQAYSAQTSSQAALVVVDAEDATTAADAVASSRDVVVVEWVTAALAEFRSELSVPTCEIQLFQ